MEKEINLLKYIKMSYDELKNLSNEELKEFESYLTTEKCANTFDTYIKRNYENKNELDINLIIEFISNLPKLSNNASWQVAIRIFCAKLHNKLKLIILYIAEKDYSFLEISEKISKLCQKIILSSTPDDLDEVKRKKLIELIKEQAIYFTMIDQLEYQIAKERLKELGMNEKDLQKIDIIKQEQLENEKKYLQPKK